MSMLRDFVFVKREDLTNSTAVGQTQGDTKILPSFRPPEGETLRAACLTMDEIRLQGSEFSMISSALVRRKSLGPEPQGPSCPFIGQGQVSGSRPGRLQSRVGAETLDRHGAGVQIVVLYISCFPSRQTLGLVSAGPYLAGRPMNGPRTDS